MRWSKIVAPAPTQIRYAIMGQWWWFVWDLVHVQEAVDVWFRMTGAERQQWIPKTVREARRRAATGQPTKGLTDAVSKAIWLVLLPEQRAWWQHDLPELSDYTWTQELTTAQRNAWLKALRGVPAAQLVQHSIPFPIVDVYRQWPKLRPAGFQADHTGTINWTGETYGY